MQQWYAKRLLIMAHHFRQEEASHRMAPSLLSCSTFSLTPLHGRWLQELREGSALEPDKINHLMATFFAIFYVDDAYLASRDPDFLQRALNVILGLLACIGLETNTHKTQAMTCTPGRIHIQLPEDSYARMHGGMTSAGEWESRMVVCHQCNALVMASSLRRHLAEQHDTY
jgi:hypothetical protein